MIGPSSTLLLHLGLLFFSASASSSSSPSKPQSVAPTSSHACDGLKNSAFVFVKPHANTEATQNLVKQKLAQAGIQILSELDISGSTIDERQLVDQHYYAIASKATLLDAKDMPVPAAKFEEAFGESWEQVLKDDRACNAMQACQRLDCSAAELNDAWQKLDHVTKLGGGFYCGKMMVGKASEPLYVFNGFFMSMRSKFVGDDKSVHCYVVEWNPSDLSWSAFRNQLLGCTDPSQAPPGSIRRDIFDNYQSLGLASVPNNGDNGVHASASPLEGLAEKSNWLGLDVEQDSFGKALLSVGVSKETLLSWFRDPQIKLSSTERGSVFDALEDMDVDECLKASAEFNALNVGAP